MEEMLLMSVPLFAFDLQDSSILNRTKARHTSVPLTSLSLRNSILILPSLHLPWTQIRIAYFAHIETRANEEQKPSPENVREDPQRINRRVLVIPEVLYLFRGG